MTKKSIAILRRNMKKMASKIFIAVQCSQCSMMQVKQQKKNSNKWTCVVCNQKQSVRKVFAQGYMAKDLRHFVQSFNISQKDQTLTQDCASCGFESRFETEMPNKKPKLSSNGGESDSGDGEGEAYTKCSPMIKAASKWSKYMSEDDMEAKTTINAGSKWHQFQFTTEDEDEQQMIHQATMAKAASKQNNYNQDDIKSRSYHENKAKAATKWDDYLIEDDGQGFSKQKNYLTEDDMELKTCHEKAAKATSKWDGYITEDDEEQMTLRPTIGKSALKWKTNSDFKTITYDQRVQDDIHPDFI